MSERAAIVAERRRAARAVIVTGDHSDALAADARRREFEPVPLMSGFARLEREIGLYLECLAIARAPLAPTRKGNV